MAVGCTNGVSIMKLKVLIIDRFSQEVYSALQNHKILKFEKCKQTSQPSCAELKTADALVIRTATKITSDFLNLTPQVKLIVTATSGFDHIDLIETQKRNIQVMYTPSAAIDSVSELSFLLMLSCSRHLIRSYKNIKSGCWRNTTLIGSELHNKTLGIIGFGRIGKSVSFKAKAFGMKVCAFDPFLEDDEFKEQQVERLSFEELLTFSHIVTLHVPLTHDTYHLINKYTLKHLNENSILINTCRGSVVCEEDIVTALKNKKLGCFGSDVFEKEPLDRQSSLLKLENVLYTPHIGGMTSDAFFKASQQATDKVESFFKDSIVSDSLPPKALWYNHRFFNRS